MDVCNELLQAKRLGNAIVHPSIQGIDRHLDEEQHWVSYAVAMLAFSFASFVIMYGIQRLQNLLPLNPQGQAAVSPDPAFNASVSLPTNTNWQSYVPETTMSYVTQMSALTGSIICAREPRHDQRRPLELTVMWQCPSSISPSIVSKPSRLSMAGEPNDPGPIFLIIASHDREAESPSNCLRPAPITSVASILQQVRYPTGNGVPTTHGPVGLA
jgi:hypothetical protein